MSRQQFEEDDSQRVDVAPAVDLSRPASIRLELLGRHVEGGPADLRGPGPVLQVDREVEIQEHRLAVVGQQDVGGLQVEVQDRPLVRMGQPARQPGAHPEDGLDVGEALQVLQGPGAGRSPLVGRLGSPSSGACPAPPRPASRPAR